MSTPTIDTSKLEAFVGQVVQDAARARQRLPGRHRRPARALPRHGRRRRRRRRPSSPTGPPPTSATCASGSPTRRRAATSTTTPRPGRHAPARARRCSPTSEPARAGRRLPGVRRRRGLRRPRHRRVPHRRAASAGASTTGMWHGVERGFGAVYRGHLLEEWLPALDGVEDKLRAGAMVADIGCGHGLSTIMMAGAFPRSAFTGYDLHAASIATARARARDAGPRATCASRSPTPPRSPPTRSTSSRRSTPCTTWATRRPRRGACARCSPRTGRG